MGDGAARGRGRRRHPAHPAGHLLPRGRPRRRRHLPLDALQLRFGDGDVDAWAARVGARGRRHGADRRRDPLGARGARATRSPSSPRRPQAGRCTSTCPSSRPRTRRASRPTGCTPTALLAAEGVLGPTHHRRARHPPDRRRHRAARRLAAPALLLPDHRARPRRRHRPGPRAARRRARRCRWAPTSTPSSTCSRRPAALEMHERLAHRRARPVHARPSCSTALTSHARRWAGRTPGGSRSARPPTWSRCGSTPSAPRAPTPPRCCYAATAADVDTVRGRRPARWSRAARTASATSARCWRRRSARSMSTSGSTGTCADHRRSASSSPRRTQQPRHRLGTPRRRGRGRRRARRLGRAPRRDAPAADRRIDLEGARRGARASSTPTPTWSSPATARAEFAARMAGERYDGGGIAAHGRRHPRRDRRRAARRCWPRRVAEMRAQGTTTVEIKSGYGLTVADEERALRIAAEVTAGDDVPRRARRARGRRPARRTSTSSPARCSPPAHRTRAGSTCSASRTARTRSTATRRAPCCKAGRAAGLGLRVHGNQLGPGPGRAARRRARRGQRRPLHPPRPTPTSTRWRAATPSRPCCPGVEFSTRSPYPDAAAAARRRASRSRWPPTATRARATRRRCR